MATRSNLVIGQHDPLQAGSSVDTDEPVLFVAPGTSKCTMQKGFAKRFSTDRLVCGLARHRQLA
ncbi:hypothetical protein SV7mr_22540 [Stieleria bergensis]|uniref:Uncharacterized protein n=1 Tax=Stieleria bergensis TaxID=2528025 RepID=A0A517SUD4_9BACT|nr:MAG: hypothetical protein CBB71_06075 [Rhodopirellula sp. TMED11]QDT59745.1 hypothetical protein SV7mr_22540 [Planctomycetes bacterium SV_7m_r]